MSSEGSAHVIDLQEIITVKPEHKKLIKDRTSKQGCYFSQDERIQGTNAFSIFFIKVSVQLIKFSSICSLLFITVNTFYKIKQFHYFKFAGRNSMMY